MINVKCLLVLFFILNPLFIISSSVAIEKKRIDIDLRLIPNNSDIFFKKINSLNKTKIISVLGEKFKIVSSLGEVFTDTYFDNNRLSLYHSNSSLRYRSRYKKSRMVSKLIQFKKETSVEKNAYIEEKIDLIKNSNVIYSPLQLKEFLFSRSEKNRVISIIKKNINIKELNPIFQVTQIRDRFYLVNDKDKVKFTLSFDKSYYKKGMDVIPYLSLELEISEKLLQGSNVSKRTILKNQLLEIYKIFKKDFIKHDNTKYQSGIKILNITTSSNHPMNTPLAIVVLLLSVLMIFKLFYKRKKNGRLLT